MKNPDIEISKNFGQDIKEAKEFGKEIAELLEPLKEKGWLDFKKITKRKCDFCGKELPIKNNGEFKTIGDKDKCKDCQKKKN